MSAITTIDIALITDEVAQLCKKANYFLPEDVLSALTKAKEIEVSETGCEIIDQLLLNQEIARNKEIPICQDTGFAVVFLEIGQDVRVVNGDIYQAINEGVRKGYVEGYLRKSVVEDPFLRNNAGTNTPAVIHTKIIPGNHIKITLAPKGGGSENMSAVKMLKPSDGIEGVKAFVTDVVKKAGPNPCPPIVVGVGIGGTMEKACIMAKEALLRPLGKSSPLPHVAGLEKELLHDINKLGIGPQGLGGSITALGVNIEVFATHIASLPVAVNLNCHVSRHATVVL